MSMHRILSATALSLVLAAAAQAEDTARLGSFHAWDAYAFSDKGGKVCYLAGTPEKSEPAGAKRGRIDAYVTQRPAEKALNVVHFDVGYPFKPGSNAELDVDGHKFQMFTDKDAAWNSDPAADRAMTEALAKGKRAVLKGVSSRGTATADTYSLNGFKDALGAIDKACKVK